jgi:hypothetical protein
LTVVESKSSAPGMTGSAFELTGPPGAQPALKTVASF